MIGEWKIPSRIGEKDLKSGARVEADITPNGSAVMALLPCSDNSWLLAVLQSTNVQALASYSPKSLSAAAISPDGSLVAAADSEGKVTIWSVADGRRVATLEARRNTVLCLAFRQVHQVVERRDRRATDVWLLAVAYAGGDVMVWDVTMQEVKAFYRGAHYRVSAVAFSPDGTILACGGRGLKLWDVATGHLLLDIPADNVNGLDFSPDGMRLAVSCGVGMAPPDVSIWKLEFERGIQTLRGLSAQVSHVCFSLDGSKLAALAHNWEVGLWDLASGQLLRIIEVPQGLFADNAALAFSQDAKQFAFSTLGEAKLWEVNAGRELRAWKLPLGLVDCLAFHPSGHLLSFRMETPDPNVGPFSNAHPANYPRICKIRDLTDPNAIKPLAEISEFNWQVHCAVAAPDGGWFVVEGVPHTRDRTSRTIRAFDGLTGAELWSLASHNEAERPVNPQISSGNRG